MSKNSLTYAFMKSQKLENTMQRRDNSDTCCLIALN